MDLGFIKMAMG